MVDHIILLNFTITTITILIFVICSSSNGYAYDFDECSSTFPCGNVSNIGFPFMWPGRHPHCGHPELQLQCIHDETMDYPSLQIVRDDGHEIAFFRLLGVWSTNSKFLTMKLLQMESNFCPVDFSKFNVVYKYLFSYSSNVSLASFLECSDSVHNNEKLPSGSIACSDLGGQSMTACYLPNQSDFETSYGYGDEHCHTFQAPVLKEELNKFKHENETLRNVLDKGFEVELDISYLKACVKCLNSGGHCGSMSSDVCLKSGKWKMKLIYGLGFLAGGVLILCLFVVCYVNTRSPTRKFPISWERGAQKHQNIEAFLKIYGSLAPKRYTYANIRKMTNNFTNKLGEGGFANVYRGKLPSGQLVAVKLLKPMKYNGDDFISELASIGRTNHVNVVALLGFCSEGKKTALVYEFMCNGSLERFTYRGAHYMSLCWEKRFDIALGLARGLDYLHRGCNARILHFDIKPHNILLNDEFCPKISDFGLARLCTRNESNMSMSKARGTIGYIAPEVVCRSLGIVSHKTDVYSYGMVVLDLIYGRTNTSGDVQNSSDLYFPEWIYKQLEDGEIVVPETLNNEEKDLQRKMMLLSLWCIQPYPSNRPSMSRVIEMLNGDLESIPMPPKPKTSSPPRLASFTSGTSTTIGSEPL